MTSDARVTCPNCDLVLLPNQSHSCPTPPTGTAPESPTGTPGLPGLKFYSATLKYRIRGIVTPRGERDGGGYDVDLTIEVPQ